MLLTTAGAGEKRSVLSFDGSYPGRKKMMIIYVIDKAAWFFVLVSAGRKGGYMR